MNTVRSIVIFHPVTIGLITFCLDFVTAVATVKWIWSVKVPIPDSETRFQNPNSPVQNIHVIKLFYPFHSDHY